jgi:transposase-like protein
VRARQMRRVLARWKRSGSTLREFGEKRGIPPSTLSWWRRVFRRAGDEEMSGTAVENPIVFSEAPKRAYVPRTLSVLEIVLPSGHLVRVPAGADSATLQRVLQALQTTC